MKKLALALVAIVAAALIAETSFAQSRGGSPGGGMGAGRGYPGGGMGGGMAGGRGGYGYGSLHGGGGGYSRGWYGGGGGWHGGYPGWRGGYWRGGYGGWYGPNVGLYFGGLGFGWPWYAWAGVPYYGYGYYPYPYGYTSYPVYAQSDPVVYVQQPQGTLDGPANAPAAANMPAVTWFYCTDPAGYYPYVQNCSKAWMRVVPDPAQLPPDRRNHESGARVNLRSTLLPLAASALLGACVTLPSGPAVMALPGTSKSFEAFQQDGLACQQYAQAVLGGTTSGQAAADNAAASALAGAAIGAASGAIIGSASGQAGPGAAIGAGTGLLFGSVAGSNAAGLSYYEMQRRYDMAYLQCMYGKGNQVPVRMGYRGQHANAPQNYPPQNYPPPNYPPPNYPPPNYPPPNYPPPNTPPPKG